MGLYAIKCVTCGVPFGWFSGNLDQRCSECIKINKVSTLKDHIKGEVRFVFYRDNQLFYQTDYTGLIFPVPIEDIGNATFMDKDKAMLFMRYIRKFLELKEESKT